jgi:hypothetical protein
MLALALPSSRLFVEVIRIRSSQTEDENSKSFVFVTITASDRTPSPCEHTPES